MTTLTFDNTHAAPRRPSKRRAQRPRPAVSAADVVLSAPVTPMAPRRRTGPLVLVALIAALHVVGIVALSGGTRVSAPPPPVPVTITFATPVVTPPPPPPPPPKLEKPVPRIKTPTPLPKPAAPPVAPAAPIVAPDTPLVAASADTVQVARAPVAEPAPPPPPPAPEPVTEPRGYAGYLSNPAPDYPVAAQKRGLEGKVILKVHVLASGKPDNVTVAKSSGHQILDDAALKAVLLWAFAPAKRGQTAVDGWVQVPLSFKL